MPFLFFFLIISLPVIEVASIVEVSRWIGGFSTFLLLAAGVAFGAFLIRSQSMTMGRRVLEAVQAGTPPEETMLESGAIMFAGVLFMIPGFFTDILALLLLLPVARRSIWRGISFGMRRKTGSRLGRGPAPGRRPRLTAPRMSSTWNSPKCRGNAIMETVAGARTRLGASLDAPLNLVIPRRRLPASEIKWPNPMEVSRSSRRAS